MHTRDIAGTRNIMADRRRSLGSLALLLQLLVLAPSARAQGVDSSCTYARCALNIIPRITALDVVRGDQEERVASLAFLFPRDMQKTFASSELAQHHAARALTTRRIAAALTDLGGALIVTALVNAATRHEHEIPSDTFFAGVALIGISVPIHFSADAELSRAVREYNRRFSR